MKDVKASDLSPLAGNEGSIEIGIPSAFRRSGHR